MISGTIQEIHKSNKKMVLAIAGGGAEAIGELLRYGGGSATVLDAHVPYCQRAFKEFIGGEPDKFVSEDAACQLAMAAFQRARHLHGSWQDVFGVGVTCSLTKTNEREGRKHTVWLATQNADITTSIGFSIPSRLIREDQETLVAELILQQIAQCCGVKPDTQSAVVDATVNTYSGCTGCSLLFVGEANLVSIKNEIITWRGPPAKIIFPGSFNPPHASHLKMVAIASSLVNTAEPKVDFEISICNIHKPMLTYKSVAERVNHFKDLPHNVWLTNAPKFWQKALIFPDRTFVVGIDTALRICNQDCYENDSEFNHAITIFNDLNINWMVFPRQKTDGTLCAKEDLENLDNRIFATNKTIIVGDDIYDQSVYNHSSKKIRAQ